MHCDWPIRVRPFAVHQDEGFFRIHRQRQAICRDLRFGAYLQLKLAATLMSPEPL